jgi:hypothetical protein
MLMGRPVRKRPLVRPRRIQENSIKLYRREIDYQDRR